MMRVQGGRPGAHGLRVRWRQRMPSGWGIAPWLVKGSVWEISGKWGLTDRVLLRHTDCSKNVNGLSPRRFDDKDRRSRGRFTGLVRGTYCK